MPEPKFAFLRVEVDDRWIENPAAARLQEILSQAVGPGSADFLFEG